MLVITLALWPDDPFSGSSFDQRLWLEVANDYHPDNPRASMVEDLRNRFLFHGMEKSKVIELLGLPESEPLPNTLSYNLGKWSGYRMDNDALFIKFDGSDRLSSVKCFQY